MKQPKNTPSAHMAEIIESRSPAGRNDSVQGWHNLLKKILFRMAPYLQEGHLVTFRSITDQESVFFEKLRRKVTVPISVGAIYMPPSVRFQMLYHRPESEPQPIPEHSPENPPDKGIVLACRKVDFNLVINALMAKPPFTPAIDVYDNGQLLAGYIYNTIDECIGDLTKVFQIHLQHGANRG
ncbi:MAG: hypothetical protein HKO68_06435 [Desulfobacterales bacterium]|nr:hypothetical protein [Desulfobacterales bacterium]